MTMPAKTLNWRRLWTCAGRVRRIRTAPARAFTEIAIGPSSTTFRSRSPCPDPDGAFGAPSARALLMQRVGGMRPSIHVVNGVGRDHAPGPGEPAVSWPGRGRTTFLEDVFHPRANGLFPFRVREDVEAILLESREDGIGDLHRRHPSGHQPADGFPPRCGCGTEGFRRRNVPRTVPRRLHDLRVDKPRAKH